MAHDFNNMLTAIKGFSSLLQMALPADDPLLAYVEEIERAADRSASLARQLLTFSRRQVTRPRVLDLNQVIRGMEEMLRRLIGEDVRLSFHLAPCDLSIRADAAQVVLNLVVDAREPAVAGRPLRFRLLAGLAEEPVAHGICAACAGRTGLFPVEELLSMTADDFDALPIGIIETDALGRSTDTIRVQVQRP